MSRGNAGAAQSAGAVSGLTEVDYRLLFEQSSSRSLVLCPDAPRFTIAAASDAYLAATGNERAAVLGRGVLELFARGGSPIRGSDAAGLAASLERVQSTKSTNTLELRSSDAAPDELPGESAELLALLVNSPMLAEDGALRYIHLCVHELGRVRAPAEVGGRDLELTLLVRERSAELESAKRELEAFNYSIAHDLRAPLRAIDGFSQALSSDYAGALDSQGKHYLDRLRAGALRMATLIDGLLELSHIQRAPLCRSSVDLGAMARKIFEALQTGQPERKVRVTIGEDLFANADASLASRALEQLCANAWKFTAKKAQAEISFCRPAGAGHRTFCLRDDGVGFAMAHATRLFSPFQRLHKQSEFEGTGVGLALVQRIVSRHGGRVWADAQPGSGASFFFTLEADDV